MACSKNKNSETKADIADVVETQDITADLEMPASTAAGTDEVQPVDPRIIFVGGVRGVSNDEIRNHFKQVGEILDVSLPRRGKRKERPLSLAYAFVSFENKEAAAEALSLHGTMLCEQTIAVQRKLPKRTRKEKVKITKKMKMRKAKEAVEDTKGGKAKARKSDKKVDKTEDAVMGTKVSKAKKRKWVIKQVKTEDAVEGTESGQAKKRRMRGCRGSRSEKKGVTERRQREVLKDE
eukprot:TRINITY_DN4417_c0_g2_i1.p1 TRINITY_DN4417_c0_g2~~TRINITY_DN4417_c0_g2_i1.p1  ORF type:complete len:236 (-),score=44.94 TRINITY_DN4417_c0_g2_i1:65-772(-)